MNEEEQKKIISNIDEISKNSRGIFLIYAGFIAYCGITAISIKDEQLIINDKAIFLPLFNIDISVTGFFLGASLTSILIYIYFNLYLYRLKILVDVLIKLHPNYDRKYLYPWLFNFQGASTFIPVDIIQNSLIIFIRWWSLPIVTILLAIQFVKTHDENLNVLLGIFPIVSVLISLFFWQITDHDKQMLAFSHKKYKNILLSFAGKLFLLVFFVFAIVRYYYVFLPNAILGNEILFFGNVIKLSNMVDLSGKSLVPDYVKCDRQLLVNFVNSRFHGANLKSSVFKNSDLKDTSFVKSRLHFTNFECSDLRGADFSNTDFFHPNFSKCDLRRVNISKANLEFTNFQDADLYGVSFKYSRLENAKFTGSRLKNADFRGAYDLTAKQLCVAHNLNGIKLDKQLFDEVRQLCIEKFSDIDNTFERKFPFR